MQADNLPLSALVCISAVIFRFSSVLSCLLSPTDFLPPILLLQSSPGCSTSLCVRHQDPSHSIAEVCAQPGWALE